MAAYWENVFVFVLYCFVVSGPTVLLTSFCLVRWLSHSPTGRPVPRLASFRGWCAALLAVVPLAFSVFVRQRWLVGWHDPDWPRGLPYPDFFLSEVHDWWDHLHPAGPYMKICGEYYAVLRGVNVMALVCCLLSGAACGYVFRNADFAAVTLRLLTKLRKFSSRRRSFLRD